MITPQEFALRIAGLGHNPTSFSRLMMALGDTRTEKQIQRNLSNYLNGSSRVPGELIIVLNLLQRLPDLTKIVRPNRQGRPVGGRLKDRPQAKNQPMFKLRLGNN